MCFLDFAILAAVLIFSVLLTLLLLVLVLLLLSLLTCVAERTTQRTRTKGLVGCSRDSGQPEARPDVGGQVQAIELGGCHRTRRAGQEAQALVAELGCVARQG